MKKTIHSFLNSFFTVNKIKPAFLVGFYGFALLIFALLFFIHFSLDIPFSHLTIDPVVELGGDAFTGLLSNFGVIMWCFTAAVCLFTAFVFSKDPSRNFDRNFFLMSFAITTLLLIDDLFLLHDIVLPQYGFRERYLYITYGILVVVYLLLFYKKFLATPYFLLIIAFGFFSLSLFTDWIVRHVNIPEHYIIEDGSKFIGIVTWGIYFTYVGYCGLKPVQSKH